MQLIRSNIELYDTCLTRISIVDDAMDSRHLSIHDLGNSFTYITDDEEAALTYKLSGCRVRTFNNQWRWMHYNNETALSNIRELIIKFLKC